MRYDEWKIYAKDGVTLRAAFRAVLKDAPNAARSVTPSFA